MVIAGEKLTIWKLDEVSSALPHWKLVWEHQDLAPITAASLSPCGTFLATTCKVSVLYVFLLTRQLSIIYLL